MTDAANLPSDLLLRRDAIVTGRSDGELARLVRAGNLIRLRRGAYVDQVLPPDVAAVHRLLIDATVFSIDWHDIQARLFGPGPSYFSYVTNAGSANIAQTR